MRRRSGRWVRSVALRDERGDRAQPTDPLATIRLHFVCLHTCAGGLCCPSLHLHTHTSGHIRRLNYVDADSGQHWFGRCKGRMYCTLRCLCLKGGMAASMCFASSGTRRSVPGSEQCDASNRLVHGRLGRRLMLDIARYSPPVSLVLLNPRFSPEMTEPPISMIPLPAFTTASAPCFACKCNPPLMC